MDALGDHPHSRGENRCTVVAFLASKGSPPLAWGKHAAYRSVYRSCRITPTRVGKTKEALWHPPEAKDHPHSRGENPLCEEKQRLHRGSPPLAWGKRRHCKAASQQEQITPTRVGKTACSACVLYGEQDHPHSRGENCGQSCHHWPDRGSPPLAWGKRVP